MLADPTDGGTVTGGGVFTVDSSQQISATANSGFSFVSWSDGGPQTHDIVVPSNGGTYTATFTAITSNSCTYTFSPSSVTLTEKGSVKTVSVKAKGTHCDWTASTTNSWITITPGSSSGTGNGKVEFTVPGNTNAIALSGAITIAGETYIVNQASGGCTYKLSPKEGKLKANSGTATITVTPNLSDCDWTAVSTNSFITIISGASGTGKGTVTYSVPANATSNVLTGSIAVAGQTFTVIQAGVK